MKLKIYLFLKWFFFIVAVAFPLNAIIQGVILSNKFFVGNQAMFSANFLGLAFWFLFFSSLGTFFFKKANNLTNFNS